MADKAFSTRSAARLLDEAIDRAKQAPHRQILGLTAAVAVLNMIYSAFTVSATSAIPAANFGAFSFLGMLIMLPIVMLAQFLAYAVIALMATQRVAGLDDTLGSALTRLFTLRVFGTLVLAGILVVISFVMLIVPGLVVSALFSFVVPVLVLENLSFVESLARSSSLAWRNPKGRLRSAPLVVIMCGHTVFVALTTGLTLALNLPVQIAVQYFTFRELIGGEQTDTAAAVLAAWLQIPLAGLGIVITGYCFYWLCIFLGLFFFEVREAREAPSLEESVALWARSEPQAP